MSKILFQTGPHQGMSVEITKEMAMGRELSCEIHIVSPDVSRRHCKVYPMGADTMVEDLGSRNGTYVNSRPIQKHVLRNGDLVSIGDIIFRFDASEVEPVATDFESSIMMQDNFDENQLEMSIAMEGANFMQLSGGGDVEKKLSTFYKVANAVAEQPDENQLFKVILECLFEIFPNAERGFVMTGDHQDNLKEEALYFRSGDSSALKISQTVVHMALNKREAMLCKDAFNDEGFSGSMSIIEEDIHSFMCVPLIAMDKIYGLMQIESTDAMSPFEKQDLDLLVGVASLSALFLRSSHLVREAALEANKRAQLARFFSPQVAENVMNKKLELGGSTKHGSVLFCDIVGFTSMSEKVSAAEMVERLNQYFEVMVKIILEENGTVDKFGGDAILSVWGAPEAISNDSFYGVSAGLRMQNAILAFNLSLIAQGAIPLEMGIGIHSGKFIAGNIGSKDRMEYTIIGDDVNTAKRVESTACGHMVMVSEAAINQSPDVFLGTQFNPVPVKGKAQPLALVCVRGMKLSDGFLLSVPCDVNGIDSKVCFSSTDGVQMKIVSGGSFVKDAMVSIKLKLPENKDAPGFEAKIVEEVADENLTWSIRCTSGASYISELMQKGIVVKSADIGWKR